MAKLVFTVTNDLTYDQRMNRICGSLSRAGFDVTLIGRKAPHSIPFSPQNYRQLRLPMLFSRGKLFYIEFSVRLFLRLLFIKADVLCAIDLDTILPVYFVSRIRKLRRVYDAHELFCEMKEVVSRPGIYRAWNSVERYALPKFPLGYTVNELIRDEFKQMYGVDYEVIRNLPIHYSLQVPSTKTPYILYQGAVNEARCFETLIPAMEKVPVPLIICGDGNFMKQAKQLTAQLSLKSKVVFRGNVTPTELRKITTQAWVGLTLFEKNGKSNYYSLANRYFDYIAAGIPQLCVNFPEYAALNKKYEVALLIDNTDENTIAEALNRLLEDTFLYDRLQKNCMQAREMYTWNKEEQRLLAFYQKHFA